MSYQILIVDDDQEFREELADSLHQYSILQSSSGEQALQLIKKAHAIDLVILDVVLAGVNGIDVLKEIRRMAPGLGIIILTGKSSKETAVEALRGSADDYIEKPVAIKQLEESIRRVMKNKEPTLPPQSVGGNHKIEKAKRFIEKNYDKKFTLEQIADEICLSPKYFSRIFKETTGRGFRDYKLKIKTKKAEELLSKTPCTVQQISEKLGYKNLESFIRLFKQNNGLTPMAYRRQHRIKEDRGDYE